MSTFSSVTNFLNAKTVPAGISTIYSGGLPIDLLLSRGNSDTGNSDTTVFFFHGAIERDFTLPVLSGLGISGGLDANRVFVSDPSLLVDENLLLAWYAGNLYQPELQEILVMIFDKIVSVLGSKRNVFFGGSGGGFASLYFATHFRDSLALVFNPQTNIAKYSERAVQDFTSRSFNIPMQQKTPLNELPNGVVWDICAIYERPQPNLVAYMQNLNDETHLQHHLLPFSQNIHPSTEFILLKEPWKEGHSPPPRELLSKVLDLSVSSNKWKQTFTNIGFIDTAKTRQHPT